MNLRHKFNQYLTRFVLKPYERKFIIPPYLEKRSILRNLASQFRTRIFVETGTFLGDTIDALKDDFERLYSIELSHELAKDAQKRFENDSKITVVEGDSGLILKQLLGEIHEPCLFWLDGHYSSQFYLGERFIKTAKGPKNTPILAELDAILNHPIKSHVILIDDSRCFVGKGDYPSRKELKEFISDRNPNLRFVNKRDIIRIFPIEET